MKDETFLFIQDVNERKNLARSARYVRTHNSKSGSIKFPSDYLSKKELKNMNSEVTSYRLNEPMSWKEFKQMPDDLKIDYITAIRNKFGAPDKHIAEMLGISNSHLCKLLKELCIGSGSETGSKRRNWHNPEWNIWIGKAEEEVSEEVEDNDISNAELVEPYEDIAEEKEEAPEGNAVSSGTHYIDENRLGELYPVQVIPKTGFMSFDGRVLDVLNTISSVLNNTNVHIDISWEVKECM